MTEEFDVAGLLERARSLLETPGAALPPLARNLIEALTNRLTTLGREVERKDEIVRLFPRVCDVLTSQEMRDAKGNLRSLIDQQTNALAALSSKEKGKD